MPETRERVQVVINSARRLNPLTETSTNFTYRINKSFTRISEIVIQSIMFPFSYYVINSSNNQLVVTRGTTKTITIPSGNYNATTMISVLNIALNNVTDPVTGFTYNGFAGENFTVTFSSVYLKFTISNTSSFSIISANTNPASTMAYNLGFQIDANSILQSGSQVAQADSCVNLAGPKYIRIESKYLTAPTQHKALYADNSYSESLFILPTNASNGSFITTDIQIPIRLTRKITISNTDTIDFKVVDENDVVIDLNGLDWAMYLVMVTE